MRKLYGTLLAIFMLAALTLTGCALEPAPALSTDGFKEIAEANGAEVSQMYVYNASEGYEDGVTASYDNFSMNFFKFDNTPHAEEYYGMTADTEGADTIILDRNKGLIERVKDETRDIYILQNNTILTASADEEYTDEMHEAIDQFGYGIDEEDIARERRSNRVILFGISMTTVLAAILFYVISYRRNYQKKATAKIVNVVSGPVSRCDKNGVSYSERNNNPHIVYSYEADGKSYKATGASRFGSLDSVRSKFKLGTTKEIFYNSNSPKHITDRKNPVVLVPIFTLLGPAVMVIGIVLRLL